MSIVTKLKLVLSILLMSGALNFAFAGISMAAIDCSSANLSTKDAIQCGTNGASGSNGSSGQATTNINGTIRKLINILSALVGVVAVIMIIIGGFRYITSGGTSEKVTSAKNTLMYAVIGLVIVALAQAIARFVLDKVTAK